VLVLSNEIAEACAALVETKQDMSVTLVASKLELRIPKDSGFMFSIGVIGLENSGKGTLVK
jgi:hypothetical protein